MNDMALDCHREL